MGVVGAGSCLGLVFSFFLARWFRCNPSLAFKSRRASDDADLLWGAAILPRASASALLCRQVLLNDGDTNSALQHLMGTKSHRRSRREPRHFC